ncbi:hypothetical protein K8I85_12175, partial [bacterium]|nr:hypothetical protein [bacterium]
MNIARIGGTAWLLVAASCARSPQPEFVRLDGYEPVTASALAAEGWRTDVSRLEVPLSALRTAHLPRGAFVPITAEGTERAADAALDDAEPVIVVRAAGGVRG